MSIFGQFLLNADLTWDDTGVSKYDPEAVTYPDPKFTSPGNGATLTSSSFTTTVANGGNVLVRFSYHFRDTPYPTDAYVVPENSIEDTLSQTATFSIPAGWSVLYCRVYYSRPDGVMGTGAEAFSEGRYIDHVFSVTVPLTVTVTESQLSPNSIKLTWTIKDDSDSPIGATGQIFYGTDAGNLNQMSAKEDTFTYSTHNQYLSGLTSGVTYYYEVRGLNAAGASYAEGGSFLTSGATVGRLNNDVVFTDNASDIGKAFDYEEQFYSQRSQLEYYLDNEYSNVSNDDWFGRDYSGLIGVRMYHFYEPMFSIGQMLRLTYIENPTHAAEYLRMALKYIRQYTYDFINLTDQENAYNPFGTPTNFHPDPRWWKYLDGSRCMAWLGYLMSSVLYTDNSYQSEFSGYANSMMTLMEPLLVTGSNPARNPHMASHAALGGLMLGRIGGSSLQSSIQDIRITDPINNKVLPYVDPWDLSDISHAAQSQQALFYIWCANKRGESLPALSTVTKSYLDAIASHAPTMFGSSNNGYDTIAPFTGSYGELVKFDSAIESHIIPATSYTSSGDRRTWVTLASIAFGYAIDAS